LIKLSFTSLIATTRSLKDPSSYVASGGVSVVGVLPIEGSTTTEVFLLLAPKATFGSSYGITLPSVGVITEYLPDDVLPTETIFTPDGVPITQMSASWVHHRTKTDAVLASLAGLYNRSTASNIRSILQAITLSDEEIGGDF
jgi:hypothetical protein